MTMTSISLHPVPSTRAVVRREIQSVGIGLRRERIAFVALLAAGLILAAMAAYRARARGWLDTRVDFAPEAAIPMAFAAALLPLFVWRDEDRRRRAYLWSMPVDTTTHSLAKVIGGWAWMMIGVAAYLIFINLVSVVTGAITGSWPTYPAHWWEWIIPFTSATITYTIASALIVGSSHPMRWVFGVLGVWLLLLAVSDIVHSKAALDAGHAVWSGPAGMTTAMWGRQKVKFNANRIPDAARWLRATALWMFVGLSLVTVAVRRRPGR
jgi:hypothetical protein